MCVHAHVIHARLPERKEWYYGSVVSRAEQRVQIEHMNRRERAESCIYVYMCIYIFVSKCVCICLEHLYGEPTIPSHRKQKVRTKHLKREKDTGDFEDAMD